MTLTVFRDNRWQGDQAILATMEVDLTRGSQMIYVIPEVMMTIGDFYSNIQISILARGYEAWQNSEANLLVTRGMVGRLYNTPNVGFIYEVQGVVDYLTSHGVNALPGRRFSTRNLQGLNWVINPTQISIPMQPAEVNSQTMMDGQISLSFSNYTAAQPSEVPNYNNKDEEVYETLAVLIETQPGVFMNYDGTSEEYYEENNEVYKGKQNSKYKTGRWDTLGQPSGKFDYYVNYDIPKIPFDLELPPPSGWGDEEDNNPKQIEDTPSERYSSTTEPHILVNKISPYAVTPTRQTEGSAGLNISASHATVIEPYGRGLIHTGLRIEIPYGYYGRLASRSGMTWKTGVEVGVGVIDSDYRGRAMNEARHRDDNAIVLLIDVGKRFENHEAPASRSFFTEIIASISDVKFAKDGRHILSRDYMTLKLWDINMDSTPVATFQVHEYLRPKCCLSGDGFRVATGSYSNLFRVFGCVPGSDEATILEASKNPMRKQVQNPTRTSRSLGSFTRGMRRGAENPNVDANGNTFDSTTKSLHLAWHPTENLIACAAANSLYMYYA
ncbi:hypothetical protein ZIOFF_051398 [Zingiber officinale]|uniref:dUTPase-like domain-containing protein n=1 Tax=Zingiber officinale TaxID=94328 RepID=A0A8J5FSP6_ZINOF|nr:hypothetical protein ZIOFF_051398 [Zingiber officinale]